jgi:SAM-dependent methyltransferase
MKDSKERFTSVVDDYAKYRPTYPHEAIDWIIERSSLAPRARILDLGCGTGISSRLFAARGFAVTGVDPNEEMLAKAREAGGGVSYARGEAARTGLPAGGFDLAVAAQAFHWFDARAVAAELRRVLAPEARAAAFWNVRADAPLLAAYEDVLRRFSSEYAALPRPAGALAAIEALPGVSRLEEARFRHAQRLDRAGMLGRARSSSYVAHGVADKAGFEAELGRLFDAHAVGGTVLWEYDAVIALFRP